MFGFSSSHTLRTLLAGVLLAAGATAHMQAHVQAVFKVTTIPDESPTELARKAAPLVKYLEKTLGLKVEFTPVTDYAAAVETLRNTPITVTRI